MADTGGLSAGDALTLLASAAREAGAIGMDFARRGARVQTKADQSPVTDADLAIDAHLANRLRAVSTDIAWLSEETQDTGERLGSRQVWIVDPIDGTRGFVAGNGEWVISAALVEDGRPIAGVLFRPTTGDLYEAAQGGGATRNGERITVAEGLLEGIRSISGPKSLLDRVMPLAPAAERHSSLSSLALRIAYLAEGRLDVACAKQNSHDWDIAAAEIILAEAGGRLTDFDGAPLRYNTPSAAHPALLGAGGIRHADLLARLAR